MIRNWTVIAVGQLIGILGGNHVLHRSLIAAAQQAAHRAIVHDGRAFARQPSRARPEPPSDTTATMPVAALADAVIIVDPTLVPGGEFAPAELASIPQERAHTAHHSRVRLPASTAVPPRSSDRSWVIGS